MVAFGRLGMVARRPPEGHLGKTWREKGDLGKLGLLLPRGQAKAHACTLQPLVFFPFFIAVAKIPDKNTLDEEKLILSS